MLKSFWGSMKNTLLLLSIIISCLSAKSQEIDKHAEIGFGVGVANYKGDLSPSFNYTQISPGAQIFYRHNYKNEVSVLRVNLLITSIKADERSVKDALPQARGLQFSRGVTELGLLYEYNFFNYRDIKNIYYMSPYLFGGMAATVLWGNQSTTILSIPFGVGTKFKMGNNLNLGIEYGARKTFSDKLDLQEASDEALSSSSPTDWYYFLGANLSYTFYKQVCPDGSPKMPH